MNLRALPLLTEKFGLPVGLSDHTLSTAVPVAAVALGASIIEEHFTLSRADGGCDSSFSLEPHEFRQMAEDARAVHRGLGVARLGPTESTSDLRRLRRSLFVVEDIKAGEPFTHRNVRAIRPGGGLHTRHLDHILGRCAECDIPRGTPLEWEHVGGGH